MKMIFLECETSVRRACRSCVSAYLLEASCPIRVLALSEPTWTTIRKRMNMPEPRRRSARRNLMEGLIRYDRINTTKARARAIRGEVEKLITVAVKGREDARKHLAAVVPDEEKAARILAFARRGRLSLDKKVATNEDRALEQKAPLTE